MQVPIKKPKLVKIHPNIEEIHKMFLETLGDYSWFIRALIRNHPSYESFEKQYLQEQEKNDD